MSDLLKKWEDALNEKLQQKGQYETALNQLTAEILQLKGGIQFAKETLEAAPAGTVTIEAEEEQPNP
tara:strand:+ start:3758 stop:3958 length:201 start_codon:yes stop_codon:yes gene_type:complete